VLAQAIYLGESDAPSYRKGKRTYFDFEAMAHAIGVPNGRLLTPRAKEIFRTLASDLGFGLRPYQARSKGFAKRTHQTTSEPNEETSDHKANEQRIGQSSQRIVGFLRPLEFLWKIRNRLEHDPIGCNPFPGGRTPYAIAHALSTGKPGRTKTIPPLQACTLINHALEWVLDYAPDLERYVNRLKAVVSTSDIRERWNSYQLAARLIHPEFAKHPSANRAGSPFPIRHAYGPGKNFIQKFETTRPALRTILFEYLASACLIVIAAFSARRCEELEALRDKCIHFIDGDPWLETWIVKNVRALDKIPVPVSVVKAVEVLKWLSHERRARTKEPWLLAFDEMNPVLDASKPGPAHLDLYRSLDRFARFVGIPKLEDGTEWTPKPHEFRRFFGVTYYHRYRYPHLTALSIFYRHFDPDVTRAYITEAARGGFLRMHEEKRAKKSRAERLGQRFDKERLETFEDEGKAFRKERYGNVVTGQENISGWGGEAIKRELLSLVAEAKLKVDISPADDLPADTLDQLLTAFAEGKRLEPNGLGHSYCKCTSEPQDLATASCLMAQENKGEEALLLSTPDPAYADDVTCSGCVHNVQLPENEGYWLEMIKRETALAACPFGSLHQELALERSELAQRHHARCFGKSSV